MSEIIGATVEEVEQQPEENVSTGRTIGLTMTFTEEGVKLDVRSNLTALEQLGAIEIFKAHLLASALGTNKE
jgi:hypothetical protein